MTEGFNFYDAIEHQSLDQIARLKLAHEDVRTMALELAPDTERSRPETLPVPTSPTIPVTEAVCSTSS